MSDFSEYLKGTHESLMAALPTHNELNLEPSDAEERMNMLAISLEDEINKRVAFKLHEFETGLKNMILDVREQDRASFGHITTRAHLKGLNGVWDRWKKEVHMGTIYDGEFEKRKKERVNKVISELKRRFLKIGTREYDRDLQSLANIIIKHIG